MPMAPIILMTVVGAAALVGGVLLIVNADRVAAPFLDILGGWVASAVRGLAILMLLVGAVFLYAGLANVFSA